MNCMPHAAHIRRTSWKGTPDGGHRVLSGLLGFALARVLIFRHRNTIHYQELPTAFLASLARHKNLIERCGSPDSRFLVAVRTNHSVIFRG
jgi:hypothetical protein